MGIIPFNKRINWFRVMLVGLVCGSISFVAGALPYSSIPLIRWPLTYCFLGSLYIGRKQKESPVLHGVLASFFTGLFFGLFFWTFTYLILASYVFPEPLKGYWRAIVVTPFRFILIGLVGGYVGSKLKRWGSVKFEKG